MSIKLESFSTKEIQVVISIDLTKLIMLEEYLNYMTISHDHVFDRNEITAIRTRLRNIIDEVQRNA